MCRSQYVEMNDALMQDAWVPCTVLTAQPVWLRVCTEIEGKFRSMREHTKMKCVYGSFFSSLMFWSG